VESVVWMDNGENLSFVQDGDKLDIAFTGYPYGRSLCVRVAEIKFR